MPQSDFAAVIASGTDPFYIPYCNRYVDVGTDSWTSMSESDFKVYSAANGTGGAGGGGSAYYNSGSTSGIETGAGGGESHYEIPCIYVFSH